MSDSNYWSRFTQQRISRRTALRGASLTGAGLAGAALIGCGDDDDDEAAPAAQATTAQAATAAAAATTAPTTAPETKVNIGGKLIHGVGTQVLVSLDPHVGQSGGEHKFFWTMFEGLVEYNRSGEPDPTISLAENWEIVDPTTLVFNLRKGVSFHNGEPFNAEVVKFNIERVTNPDTKSAAAGQIGVVEQVDVIDEFTVRFKLGRPNGALLTLLGDRGGQQVPPKEVERAGDQFGLKPVGTGAFRFKEGGFK